MYCNAIQQILIEYLLCKRHYLCSQLTHSRSQEIREILAENHGKGGLLSSLGLKLILGIIQVLTRDWSSMVDEISLGRGEWVARAFWSRQSEQQEWRFQGREMQAYLVSRKESVWYKLGYAEGEGDDEAVKVACCRELAKLGWGHHMSFGSQLWRDMTRATLLLDSSGFIVMVQARASNRVMAADTVQPRARWGMLFRGEPLGWKVEEMK